MVLNKRQSELLDMLLQGKNIQLEELEKQFNVSRRTIYNDISHVKEFCEQACVHLVSTSNSLLTIGDEIDKKKLEKKLSGMNFIELPFNQLSRSNLVIAKLLFDEEPPYMNDLYNSLGISRSTFYRDLEYIRYWFDKFEIQIIITKTEGIVLSGKESKIREAMVFFVRKNFDEFDLWMNLQNKNLNCYKHEKAIIYAILQNYFKKYSFSLPAQILEKMQNHEMKIIQDKEKLFFIWMLMMSLGRIERNFEIEADGHYLEILEYFETEQIYELLNQNLFFKVNKLESAAITFYYITAKKRSLNENDLTFDLDTQIMRFVEKISNRLAVPLIRDVTFIEGLRLHIINTKERLRLGMIEINPMKEEIMERYPNIFEICANEIDLLQFEKTLEDDEIAYIVIYIAAAVERLNQSNRKVYAVCTSGRGSAELLLVNLKNKFPDLNVLGTISMMNAIHVSPAQADAIISTTQICNASIPVITVSPLLLKEDVIKIQKALKLNADNSKVIVSSVFSQNDMGFMDTMYLLSDCANAMDEIIHDLHLDLTHTSYVGVLIHLMLQLNRSENIKKINKNQLSSQQKILFNILNPLYNKFNKILSDYDIRSIQTYLTDGKEFYEDIIKKR